jgi:predicted ATP-grasp superfamily ATP-dependent carboligase
MSRGPLLIVGASGRAAAASAIRAGFSPFVIDLFGDEDTRRLCPVWTCPLEAYPHGVIEIADRVPPMPWMYTGGIENHPEVVAAISRDRELMGNGPQVLNAIRNPLKLAETLQRFGGQFPLTLMNGSVHLADPAEQWLRKSIRSSGGMGVADCQLDSLKWEPLRSSECLQVFVDGVPMSALFHTQHGQSTYMGATRQLIGEPWLHARKYGYAGNITTTRQGMDRSKHGHGPRMAEVLGFSGVWGYDFIHTRDHGSVTCEVNPRYTASCELFDFVHGRSVLEDWSREPVEPSRAIGKAIYYAAEQIIFPPAGPWDESLAHCTDVWRRPDYADIPTPGQTLERSQPVLTIFAEGETEQSVLNTLKTRAADLDRRLGTRPTALIKE